jgi:hypothetical protein
MRKVSSIGGVILHVATCTRRRGGMQPFRTQAREIALAWKSDLERVQRKYGGGYSSRHYQCLDGA